MIQPSDLAATASALETAAAIASPANATDAGYWYRICRASEQLAALSLSAAGLGEAYYVRRAAVALETVAGGSGAEETAGYWGDVKRIVDALELKGVVGSGSLANRLRAGAIGAVFGPTYDPDATALFARMTVQPNATIKGHYSTLYAALKACGAYPLRQVYVSLWAHTQQAALLNLKGTSFTPSVTGGAPTFAPFGGLAFDGVDDVLSTGWAGTDAPQDAVSIDLRIMDTAGFASNVWGNGSNIRMNPRTSGGSDFITGRLNNGGSSTTTVITAAGLTGMQRTDVNTIEYWRDGVQVGADVASISNTPSASPLTIGASGALFTACRAGWYALGGVLDAATRAGEVAAWQAFETAVGAA